LNRGDGNSLAPFFVLPSALGGEVSLETYVGENNVVLVFNMGFW
jgi:peroxiredoxin